jgi:SWI/SNF-related matrix-associated actin-dependent regulator 1 of chromatin subfamily A
VEFDWNPAVMTQAEDRCHRIGQKEVVLVQHLVLANSLDVRMAKTLVRKQSIIDRALNAQKG